MTADEVEALRRRVAELEAELADQARAYGQRLAETQERMYWLDRWGLDLNELMRRPIAKAALAVARRGRAALRLALRLRKAGRR